MKEYVLKTEKLTKRYGNVNVLDNVSLELEQGRIYGLIGRNGAGKTTLMRIIAGLAFPSTGKIELFGKNGTGNLQEARKRVGCMIEYPGFIPSMSAKENLEYHRIVKGIPDVTVIDEILETVGLSDTKDKKAKDFSLGMKQRLGIGIALLGNPELLILDEPINGLDPIGVVEIRKLLARLCEEKQMTILISSHNLPELYQVATDYIIIHQGVIRQKLTLEELDEKCRHHILIGTDQPDRLVEVLESNLKTINYRVMPDKMIRLYDFLDEKEKVARIIFENGIMVTEYTIQGDTLENYFISVIGGAENA